MLNRAHVLKTIRYHLITTFQNPVVRQSLLTLLIRVFGVVLLFGFTLFLTQKYDPKQVGQYDFVRTFLFAIGSICLLGFDQSILYFKGRLYPNYSLGHLKKVYLKMVLMLFLASLLLFLFIELLDASVTTLFFADNATYFLLLKASAVMFFYGLSILNVEVFRALEKIVVAELFRNIFKYLPIIVLAVLLVQWQLELYLVDAFLLSFVFLGVVTTLLTFYFLTKKTATCTTDCFSSREIITQSFPIAVSGTAIFLMMSFDILFLKKYQGDAAVAFYSVAVKLMTLLSVIILTVNITVSASIAASFSNKEIDKLQQIVQNSSRLIVVITLPAVIGLFIFPEFVLHFFGPNYLAAKEALLVLVLGQGFCAFFGSAPVYLNMTGRQRIFQRIVLAALGLNFILNYWLIPSYGMVGGAIAFSASAFFWNFGTAIFVYYKDGIKLFLS
ncbi:O-antigen/teichoic acid export membrane protein [Flavobacterium tiangeerense]|uniref:O-antigen/teichoic acid export membrane protein n=1 Tax=Flavobacterium tiangeerense TaxID=459471 RepID=A0ABY3FL53_9FLAO|nr:O-antigen/teichoic acid export membrane protein [Flavobacterium tiangeerense]